MCCHEDNFGTESWDHYEWDIRHMKTNGGLISNESEHQQRKCVFHGSSYLTAIWAPHYFDIYQQASSETII